MNRLALALVVFLSCSAYADDDDYDDDEGGANAIGIGVGIAGAKAKSKSSAYQKQIQGQVQGQDAKTGDIEIKLGDDKSITGGNLHAGSLYTASDCQAGVNGGASNGNSAFLGVVWTNRDCKVMRQASYLRQHYGPVAGMARDCKYRKFRRAINKAAKIAGKKGCDEFK